MSKDPQASVDILNLARSMELVAIAQYMQHHYALDNLMYPSFAKAVKRIAIDEMRHAEMLSERIRELGGIPHHGSLTGSRYGGRPDGGLCYRRRP